MRQPTNFDMFYGLEIQELEPTILNCRLRLTNSQREQEEENKELSYPSPNAALSGEQRKPPNLSHCTLNTKFNLN
ncbi:hypothetical protein VV99743_03397 [Vibrio vulnificus]|nr:hypothetical protein VV99743_03397 [Vibrio vulnificus]